MTSTDPTSPADAPSEPRPGARDSAFSLSRGLLFATVLVPVVIDPQAWFPFVTTRAVFFRVLLELATGCLLFLALRHDTRASFRRDPIFLALFAFTGAMALATVFSPAPWRSMFGELGRMGGLWAWFHLLAYYIALRTFFDAADWRRYIRAVVVVALAVSLYGVIQYYQDVLRIPWEGEPGGAIHATVGNSGLLAIYLGLTFGLLALLAAISPPRRWTPYVFAALTLLFTIFLARNRSTILGGVAGSGAGLLVYGLLAHRRRKLLLAAGIGLIAAGLSLPLLTTVPAVSRVVSAVPVGARLSQGVDPTRVLQWRAAVNGIRERPVLGYGPENYHLVWSRFGEPEMLRHIEDVLVWDRAHNAYLDVFATMGVIGLLAFVALWAAIGWTVITGARAGSLKPAEAAILVALTVWYAVYLLFWFFDLNSTMLWLAAAAYAASRTGGQPLIRFGARTPERLQSRLILAGGAVALAATLYTHGYETLRLTRTLRRLATAKQPPQAMLADFGGAFESGAPDTHYTFLLYSNYLRGLLPRFQEMRQDPALSTVLDAAFNRAFANVDLETRRDPLNERMALQKGRIALLAWAYYDHPRFREIGLASLQHAAELAPRRVGVRIALASAHETDGRLDSAAAQLHYAVALYPRHAPGMRGLADLYLQAGHPRIAANWLKRLTDLGYSANQPQVIRVAGELMRRDDAPAADSLLTAYFHGKYGPPLLWPLNPRDDAALPDEIRLARLWREAVQWGGAPHRAAQIDAAVFAWCSGRGDGGLGESGAFRMASPDSTKSFPAVTCCACALGESVGE